MDPISGDIKKKDMLYNRRQYLTGALIFYKIYKKYNKTEIYFIKFSKKKIADQTIPIKVSPNLNIGKVLLHVGAYVASGLHGQLGRRLALVRRDACQSDAILFCKTKSYYFLVSKTELTRSVLLGVPHVLLSECENKKKKQISPSGT